MGADGEPIFGEIQSNGSRILGEPQLPFALILVQLVFSQSSDLWARFPTNRIYFGSSVTPLAMGTVLISHDTPQSTQASPLFDLLRCPTFLEPTLGQVWPRGLISAGWAFYVQVVVPMRLPDAARLPGSNLLQAGFWTARTKRGRASGLLPHCRVLVQNPQIRRT